MLGTNRRRESDDTPLGDARSEGAALGPPLAWSSGINQGGIMIANAAWHTRIAWLGASAALAACGGATTAPPARPTAPAVAAAPAEPSAARLAPPSAIIDLTQPFDQHTVYYPDTRARFRLRHLHQGVNEAGYYYAADALAAPANGGTHIAAPLHRAYGGQAVDELALDRLVAPAVVIDMCAAAEADADAELRAADLAAFEARRGPIEPGSIVLVRTCWSERWPDRRSYLGEPDEREVQRHFPGVAESAAVYLIDRGVAAIGIDTASVDHGPSVDFVTHRVLAAAGVPVFVNLTALDQVPERGGLVAALPMKIAGGASSPLRIVALVP
jgi:kynurenine formamidase